MGRLLLILMLAAAAPAQEKNLRWTELAVNAHLDAEGKLHVRERHTIRFNGDWNGGERTFRSAPEPRRDFEGIDRIDGARAIPLRQNDDLDRIDDYALKGSTLRWRSRLPSDPPFADTDITYVIRFSESYVVVPRGEAYLLDHNFGLPELEWPIDAYSLDLTFDPVWQAGRATPPQRITRANLPRGENVTVTALLDYTGAGRPSAVNHYAPRSLRAALAALLLGGVALLVVLFIRRERNVGRFRPLTDPADIDRRWLDEHLFRFAPEVVGAAWDERTGSAEVAAVIARLVQEKKLRSRVETAGLFKRANLVLERLQPLDQFEGYEKALVTALFFGGDTTSTDQIRRHYRHKGFNPISRIKAPLERRLREVGKKGDAPKLQWWPSAILVAAGLALVIAAAFLRPLNALAAVVGSVIVAVLYAIASIGAVDYRRRVTGFVVTALPFAIPIVLLMSVALAVTLFRFPALTLIGFTLMILGAIRSILNIAATRHGGERLETRRDFAAARAWFARELRQPQPALDDAWFPWLLAFGLGPHIDRWFRSFGGAAMSSAASSSFATRASSSSSSAGGSSGWTGGGGTFGGAGATGSWAVAAAGMASGVSAPGSGGGSSGGGGGGGGGSSGGGGGGGW